MEGLIGKAIFVRTVTYHYVGELEQYDEEWLRLSRASWVADSGRWAAALATGTLSEVEPYMDDVYVARAAVVDVTAWRHALPTEAK